MSEWLNLWKIVKICNKNILLDIRSTKCNFYRSKWIIGKSIIKTQRKNLSRYILYTKPLILKIFGIQKKSSLPLTCCWNLTIVISCWAPGDNSDPMERMMVWTLWRSTRVPAAGERVAEFAEAGLTCTTTLLTNTHGFSPKESNYCKTKSSRENNIR